MDKDFLLTVFREVNDHIRSTEQKYLLITAAYFGLLTIFLGVVKEDISAAAPNPYSKIVNLTIYAFFLLVGLTVHMKQRWYRAWKEHYLEVCCNTAQQFLSGAKEAELRMMPFWLRKKGRRGRFSIDNMLNYFTVAINSCLLLGIIMEGSAMVVSRVIGILDAVFLIVAYLLFMYYVSQRTASGHNLVA